MAEQECRVGAAERVARTDDAVVITECDRRERDVGLETRRRAADRTRCASSADRLADERKFDEPAAAERVAETSFPGDERRLRKRQRERGALESAGLQCTRAVPLEPHAPAI